MLATRITGTRVLAVTLLTSLMGLYANQTICNIEHLKDASGKEHSHPFGHSHHHHEHEHDHSAPAGSHDHDQPTDQSCCNELILVFLSHTVAKPSITVANQVPAAMPTLTYSLPENPFAGIIVTRPRAHAPPLAAGDLRIYIQSFQI